MKRADGETQSDATHRSRWQAFKRAQSGAPADVADDSASPTRGVRRRQVPEVLATLALFCSPSLFAQEARVARIGVLSNWQLLRAGARAPVWLAFYDELAQRGWVEGRNLQVEWRFVEGGPERLALVAADLVAAKPEVILGTSSNAIEESRTATRTIPIVMVTVSHAVEAGFVNSLAKPGGNVTGVVSQSGDLQDKRIELLRLVRPDLKRMGVLWNPQNTGSVLTLRDAKAAAVRAGMQLIALACEKPGDLERALAAARRDGVQALQVHPTIVGTPRQVAMWAIEQRVATLGSGEFVRNDGGLLAYGAESTAMFRIAADFVDRILRGARAGALPVQQPTRFSVSLNLKTARAMGLSLPQALLLRVEELIE